MMFADVIITRVTHAKSELIMTRRTRLNIVAWLVSGLVLAAAAQAQHYSGSHDGGSAAASAGLLRSPSYQAPAFP